MGFRFWLRTTGEREEKSPLTSTEYAPMHDPRAHERDGLTRAGIVLASWSLGLRSHAALASFTSALKRPGPEAEHTIPNSTLKVLIAEKAYTKLMS